MRLTIRDAVGWIRAAALACEFYVSGHYRGIVLVSLDALEWGTTSSQIALARAYELQAMAHLRRMAKYPIMFGYTEVRVLGFCAAVLRATVEESGEGAALVTESDELCFLRAELAAVRASVRALETTVFLRERERDEARQAAEGRKRDLHEASRQVEDHARREVAAESRAKAAEAEVERLRAKLLVVEILAKDWDELAERLSGADWNYREGLRYCAKKLRKALGDGGRS